MRIHRFRPSLVFAFVFAFVASLPSTTAAQTVNPTVAEFAPSADHHRIALDGQAWLTRYELGFYQTGASSPFQVVSLGKPAPQADGFIRVNLSTMALPSPGIVYEARVTAVGPAGSAASAASNTFMFAAPCSYSVTPNAQSLTATAWSGTIAVSTGTGCQWTAVSNSPTWLSFAGGASSTSGTGGANVSIAVAANASSSPRSGTFTVAGQTIAITQAGVACSFSASPVSLTVPAAGGTSSVVVTSPAGCAWTATSGASWLSITAATGSGTGSVSLSASPNTTTSPRTTSLTVEGRTVSVTQNGVAPCSFSVSPTTQSLPADGGARSVSVTAGTGCNWSASTDSPSWITLGAPAGTGSGSLTYTVAPNAQISARSGSLTVAGYTISITQDGAACGYGVTPSRLTVPAAGVNGSLSVNTLTGCAWSASSDSPSWLWITAGASGNGPGGPSYAVATNPLGTPRVGTLTVAGQSVTVTQDAAPAPSCTYTVGPLPQSVPATASAASFAVTAPAGCAWTASSNTSWLGITAGLPGSGNGFLSFGASANTLTSPRTGTLTIAGQTVTVIQAAAECAYAVTPTSHRIAAGGGTALGAVTSTSGCAWTTSSPVSWLTVSGGRTGTGDYTLTAAPNTGTVERSVVVTIAGTSVAVTQPAPQLCRVTVAVTSLSVGETASNGSVDVTAGIGCAWTASSSEPWLTITSGTPGSGNGSVVFRVEENTTKASRSATLTIGGQTVTVTQGAVRGPKGPKRVRVISTN